MKWRHNTKWYAVSGCGRYAVTGGYTDGRFSWRGRFIQTDELVQASADREFVELCCERHEARLAHEAAHGNELGGHPHDDNEADIAARAAT